MGQYNNFIEDFSGRCDKMFDEFYPLAEKMNLDISFLLMFSATVFTIPHEKLKSSHPMSEERKQFKSKVKRYNEMLRTDFLKCDLWEEKGEANSWKYKEMESLGVDIQNPNRWPSPDRLTNQKLSLILKIVRNSLAHGNIYTLKENKISGIRFITFEYNYDVNCRPKEITKVRYLDVSPEDFMLFVKKWVYFLKSNIEKIKTVWEDFSEAEHGLQL